MLVLLFLGFIGLRKLTMTKSYFEFSRGLK